MADTFEPIEFEPETGVDHAAPSITRLRDRQRRINLIVAPQSAGSGFLVHDSVFGDAVSQPLSHIKDRAARLAIIVHGVSPSWESVVRMVFSAALAILLAGIPTQPSLGEDDSRIVGTWRLRSYVVEVQATGEKLPAMGENPAGYVTFLPEGRVFFVLTGDGRKPAKTEHDRAELLNTLVAYTGTYSTDGSTWTTSVEVAWNPEWVGTRQVRSFRLDGNRLEVLTPWRTMPNWPDKGMTRSIISFERAR